MCLEIPELFLVLNMISRSILEMNQVFPSTTCIITSWVKDYKTLIHKTKIFIYRTLTMGFLAEFGVRFTGIHGTGTNFLQSV